MPSGQPRRRTSGAPPASSVTGWHRPRGWCRRDPAGAIDFVAQHLRPQDAVCIGVFPKDKPDMLREDLDLLQTGLAKAGKR